MFIQIDRYIILYIYVFMYIYIYMGLPGLCPPRPPREEVVITI